MRDCENARMRDLLPDLLHDRLAADVRAEVEAHIAGCADCRAEFALLRRVQAAASAVSVPAIDASRIAAGLPRYRRSAWSAASQSWPLRAAAAVVLVVGAATMLRDRSGPGAQPDSVIASAAGVATSPAGGELSVGGLNDIPDTDLQALLDAMSKLEAVTPSEPDAVVVPAVGRGSEP